MGVPRGITFTGEATTFGRKVWRSIGKKIGYADAAPSKRIAAMQSTGKLIREEVAKRISKEMAKTPKVQADILRDILREVRDFGKSITPKVVKDTTGKRLAKELADASKEIPSDWSKKIDKKIRYRAIKTKRGYHSTYKREIVTSGSNAAARKETWVHELGHAAEYADKDQAFICRKFLKSRKEPGEGLTKIYPHSPKLADEVGWKDGFREHYIGKYYPNATEISSMGIEEALTHSSYSVSQHGIFIDRLVGDADEDFADFIFGLLAGF